MASSVGAGILIIALSHVGDGVPVFFRDVGLRESDCSRGRHSNLDKREGLNFGLVCDRPEYGFGRG